MAAPCLGSFGSYQYLVNRERVKNKLWDFDELKVHSSSKNTPQEHHIPENAPAKCTDKPAEETVWVVMRYTPLDLRGTAPVPRYKPVTPSTRELPTPGPHWIPAKQMAPQERNSDDMYRSTISTRCEEWSTLRQMLPSRGHAVTPRPPHWGSSYSEAPQMSPGVKRNFSTMSSPMSRFVDDMHKTNKLFTLF